MVRWILIYFYFSLYNLLLLSVITFIFFCKANGKSSNKQVKKLIDVEGKVRRYGEKGQQFFKEEHWVFL